MFTTLHIEYANPSDLSDSITVTYRLRQTSIAQRWVNKILQAQAQYQIDDPARFYGFGSYESQVEDALDRINQNIMIINEKISLGLVGGILTVAHFKLTFLTKNNALYLLADNGELIAEVNPTFRKFYEDRLQLVRKQQLIEPPSGIENIKKVIAEKIKKGPQEFKSQELELKKALEKLQAALRKLHYALVHSA